MASTSYRIRRGETNSGGSNRPASATNQLTDSIGNSGGHVLSGAIEATFTGISNVISHPNTILDLSAVTGTSLGELTFAWTAPAAYGSTGTASSYWVTTSLTPINSEPDFAAATTFTQSWVPLVPGQAESHVLNGLIVNTTYYGSVKAMDRARNSAYVSNAAGASTLTNPITAGQIYKVYGTSITANWATLGGSGGAEGYRLEASTASNFNGTIYYSSTTDVNTSTLTVTGLTIGETYWLRAGGLNWNDVANFVALGSTTTVGDSPAPAAIANVFITSITVNYTTVGGSHGYELDASSTNFNGTGVIQSSITSVQLSALTVDSLIPNTTYWLKVGSLWNGPINYTLTVPTSSSTLASDLQAVQYAVYTTSIAVNWTPFTAGSGANKSEGYILIGSSTAFDGTGTVYLSSTTNVVESTQTLAGLETNKLYTLRAGAINWNGAVNWSWTGSAIIVPTSAPTNIRFLNVQTSSITAEWDPVAQPNTQYVAELAPPNPFAVSFTSNTLLTSAAFAGLSPNAPYYFRMRAQERTTLVFSFYSGVISTYTLANPPVSLATTTLTSNSVGLSWAAGGNPGGTLYSLERSTDGVLFTSVNSQTEISALDLTVSPGTTYMYRVRALNGNQVASAPSNTVLVTISGVPVAPKRPSGLWMERVSAGGSSFLMTYHWRRVTQRADGSALPNLAGYQIYTSPSLLTPRAKWALLTTVTVEQWNTTAGANAVNYYALRAVDTSGLQSDWTQALDDSSDMNHFFLNADNISRVQLPQSAANSLRREHNVYGSDLWLAIEERTTEEIGRVVRSMKIDITNADTNNPVTDLVFDPPVLRGVLAYSVVNGNIVAGAPEPASISSFGTARVPIISAANAAQQLSLFWYNGSEWVKTTGLINSADSTVSFTGSRAGAFQIRAASHSGAMLTRVYPRIITPNGDGWNDKAIFQFDNPQLLPITGKMYDISGAFVGNLKTGPNPDSSLVWDGKDSGGTVVPGGVYLYQIDLGGTAVSGTVVVAR